MNYGIYLQVNDFQQNCETSNESEANKVCKISYDVASYLPSAYRLYCLLYSPCYQAPINKHKIIKLAPVIYLCT